MGTIRVRSQIESQRFSVKIFGISTLQRWRPTPVQTGPIQKCLTLIRKEPNSQNSAFRRKDYRIYLYHIFDLIFQPITPFVGLSSQCSRSSEEEDAALFLVRLPIRRRDRPLGRPQLLR